MGRMGTLHAGPDSPVQGRERLSPPLTPEGAEGKGALELRTGARGQAPTPEPPTPPRNAVSRTTSWQGPGRSRGSPNPSAAREERTGKNGVPRAGS